MYDLERGSEASSTPGSQSVTINGADYDIEPIPTLDPSSPTRVGNDTHLNDDDTGGVDVYSFPHRDDGDDIGTTLIHTTPAGISSTWEYLLRHQLLSRIENPRLKAGIERLLLLALFMSQFMEGTVNFLLRQAPNSGEDGTTSRNMLANMDLPSRGFVETTMGTIGYQMMVPKKSSRIRSSSTKKATILCIHSSPRSSDEFADVLPFLSEGGERKVVAVDVPGYGWSENPNRSCDIGNIAATLYKVATTLSKGHFVVLGSGSLGNFLAIAMAGQEPRRMKACITTNLLYFPAALQRQHHEEIASEKSTDDGVAKPDGYQLHEDGSHLMELHNQRKNCLDPELNLRYIQSELTYLVNRRQRYKRGISIQDVSTFDLETATAKLKDCPVLCVRGEAALSLLDNQGIGGNQRCDTACRMLPSCEVQGLSGPRSTDAMINQSPEEFVSICLGFLEKHST